MTRFVPGRVPALAAILATFYSSHVQGVELACEGLRLEVEPELSRRFPGLAESVRSAFSTRSDTDACPEVRLDLAQQAIRLEVALADGRSTVRSLAGPEDVVPTLQALVIVPERREPASAAKPSTDAEPEPAKKRAHDDHPKARPRVSTVGAPRKRPAADGGLFPAPTEVYEPSALRIELSTYLGAHSGESSRSSLNFGVSTLLDIHRFLAGLQLRVDQYQGMPDGQGGAFELAALLGRRFDFEIVGLDLVLGPSAAFQGSSSTTEPVLPEMRRVTTTSTDENAAYACFAARGSLFPESALRPFVAADAAFRLDETSNPGTEVFPGWALGVAVGVTVGTL